jgi:hypothetical protein
MTTLSPIALIVFSNDLDNFLPSIEEERNLIEEALQHYDDSNRLKVIARTGVTIEGLFKLFNRYKGRIALFHFAGHAHGKGLQLAENANSQGLTDLFRREATEGQLRLVFLNGCSTKEQVAALRTAGVSSVIATNCPINDNKALEFSKQFYRSLSNADQTAPFDYPTTLQKAFDTAKSFFKTKYNNLEANTRGFVFSTPQTTFEWELHTDLLDWTLPVPKAKESKVFNEILTRKLLDGLAPYSKQGAIFAQRANQTDLSWETNLAISNKAKEVIVYNFVGILGVQLQKLFAIGKENNSATKQRNYLQTCFYTAKRTLTLLNFCLISKLWDFKKENKTFHLSETQRNSLQHFFENSFESDILACLQLSRSLSSIFLDNNLPFSMVDLTNFQHDLMPESLMTKACEKLQLLNKKFDKEQFEEADCFAVEKQLTIILEKCLFFANYKMASVKSVAYDEMRNKPPRYIHTLIALGFDAKQKENIEQIKYEEHPITTDSVVLHRGHFHQGINLFPFLIDFNALTFENRANICFYESKEMTDGSLNYRFLENNSVYNLVFEDIAKKEPDFTAIVGEPEKFKTLKLDTVYLEFRAAEKDILGDNADESWLDDIFEDEF